MKIRTLHKKLTTNLIGMLSVLLIFQSGFTKTMTLDQQFQQELAKFQEQYQFPGATAAYILPDGTTGTFAVGSADLELKPVLCGIVHCKQPFYLFML